MPLSNLDYQKERMKANKKLRDIQKLKDSTVPLNSNQLAKVNKEKELLQWLDQLSISECELDVNNTRSIDYTFISHVLCTDSPFGEHQHAPDNASQTKAGKPYIQSPEERLTRSKGKKSSETKHKQECRQQSLQSDGAEATTCDCATPQEMPCLAGTSHEKCTRRVVTVPQKGFSDIQSLEDVDVDSTITDQHVDGNDPAKNIIIALEQEVSGLKKRNRTHEEERKKSLRRQGQMATEMDKSKVKIQCLESTLESHNAAMEAQRVKFVKEREEMLSHHAKEKDDLQRSVDQMSRTLDTARCQTKQVQMQLTKKEERAKELMTMLEEKSSKVSELQELVDTKGLDAKVARQKEKVKKISAKISRREREMEQQQQKKSELSAQLQEMQQGCAKLETQNKKLVEERRNVAEGVAADLFSAGRQLEAFLKTIEPELLCPITYELPDDPALAADGWTYERTAIARWQHEKRHLETCANSPMTGVELLHEELTPNLTVGKLIALSREWQTRCSNEVPGPCSTSAA